ncbi:hypothetical protein ZYGR_0A00620 [Zygosaccharomyces rouxii]|uniref:Regulator of rDNA transcription 14 n=2 Tax=Zygosaccharomyces rouxii TaxID=4956 RepID=RRT14_ZYGRC|nr:uncharacterized protein ZYRO0A01320g [Zygosaccharomyces rouxii]C5DP87.1 RecName: Full=Regulator of rDNA transcription 14 [Zygosaccharomyces rouxii CBS 732]KAH9198982.1 regulator of rDNA transcription 14 [Zygosaccharomyces rouxii]GAV46470.1 hypothetical protein ZYGR_0A00620 [Zygosaccharomyces rouxii]CAR25498.1 ZYRO0A01320p [Zygosaccharomyces rouxii]
MSSNVSQLHANDAVKGLLAKMLPGAVQSAENSAQKTKQKQKGSKAQLIDRNLKRRVQLQELDVEKLKKKQSRIRRRDLQKQRRGQEEIKQLAELEVLERHRKEGKLTKKETKHLNRLVNVNAERAKSWELDEDEKEDLLELQKYILEKTTSANRVAKSQKRRQKKKTFNDNKKGVSASMARRYPGLTPGLAPVDMSDEEESSEEEEEVEMKE